MLNKKILFVGMVIMTLIFCGKDVGASNFPEEMTGYEIASIWSQKQSLPQPSSAMKEVFDVAEIPGSYLAALRNMRLALDKNLLIDLSFYNQESLGRIVGKDAELTFFSRQYYAASFGEGTLMERVLKVPGNRDLILSGSIDLDSEEDVVKDGRLNGGRVEFKTIKTEKSGISGIFRFSPPVGGWRGSVEDIQKIFGVRAEQSVSYFNAIEWSKEAVAEAIKRAKPGEIPFMGYSAPATNELGNKAFTFKLDAPAMNAEVTCTTLPNGSLRSVYIKQTEK